MNEQNYWMVERLAELRRAEMLAAADAERLARQVDQRPEREPAVRGPRYRLAYAAAAVMVFLAVVAEMVAAAGL
jgi:hypothetical protein